MGESTCAPWKAPKKLPAPEAAAGSHAGAPMRSARPPIRASANSLGSVRRATTPANTRPMNAWDATVAARSAAATTSHPRESLARQRSCAYQAHAPKPQATIRA